jgi:hypothetical protein
MTLKKIEVTRNWKKNQITLCEEFALKDVTDLPYDRQ